MTSGAQYSLSWGLLQCPVCPATQHGYLCYCLTEDCYRVLLDLLHILGISAMPYPGAFYRVLWFLLQHPVGLVQRSLGEATGY